MTPPNLDLACTPEASRPNRGSRVELAVVSAGAAATVTYCLAVGSLPVRVSIAYLALLSGYALLRLISKGIGLVLFVYWVVFVLPFAELLSYWDYNFGSSPPRFFWGLMGNPYMFDEMTVELTGTLGVLGGLGFAVAIAITSGRAQRQSHQYLVARLDALPMASWIVLPILAGVLAWWSAPRETIFVANYATSAPPIAGMGFDSAWLVGFGLVVLAVGDCLFDSRRRRRRIKLSLIIALLALEVVVLQLATGDREILSLVLAVVAMMAFWSPRQVRRLSLARLSFVMVPTVILLLVAGQVVGGLRSTSIRPPPSAVTPSAVTPSAITPSAITPSAITPSEDIRVEATSLAARALGQLHGTWSAVLLTPLSAAGDYLRGRWTFKFGKDYRDLVLSVPPGFVAQAFGYQRPIDGTTGPAWRMRYGNGGIHAVVLPFMNFGLLGIVLVIGAWSLAIGLLERKALNNLSIIGLTFLGFATTVAPHWLWYGDKVGITSAVIFGLLAGLYLVLRKFSAAFSRNFPV